MSVAEPIHGADISDYQRGIDLEQVKREGYEFCVVKASEGPYRDGTNYLTPSYGRQVDASQIAGLLTGAYHFLVETPAEAQGRGCCYVPVPLLALTRPKKSESGLLGRCLLPDSL